jgi:hypothetical protein
MIKVKAKCNYRSEIYFRELGCAKEAKEICCNPESEKIASWKKELILYYRKR